MDKVNLLCDISNCGEVAHAFGIRDEMKEKCCKDHVPLLTSKKMTIYDISGYYFISSFEDVPLYEERRGRIERGLGNVTALEAQCDFELFEAQRLLEDNEKKAIAAVVRSYQEIRLQVQRKYETSKQQLQAMRHSFEQYLISKQNDLQESAQLLCSEIASPLRFLRLAAEDCMLEIVKVIGRSWTVSKEGVEAIIACLDERKRTAFLEQLTVEANDELRKGHTQKSLQLSLYAQALGWKGEVEEVKRVSLEKQIECIKELQDTFQLATDLSDIEKTLVKSTAAECLQAGLTAKSRLDSSQSRNWLQNAWDILEKSGSTEKEVTVVGLVLWEVVALHFANYAAAERILRHCYDIEARLDPLSEDAMKVSNSIAGVFYHSGKWNCVVEVCTRVLETFSSTNHAAEHFWTTLQYLTHSYWYLDKSEEVQTLVEQWESKPLCGENELSRALKLTVRAEYARKQGNDEEAEKLFIEASEVADECFPTSVLAALDHRFLGILYKDLKLFIRAEECYEKARDIFEAVSPQSILAAINLNSMGILYRDWKRFSDAEEHYMKAKAIYEAVSPESLHAANNIYNMANLYKEWKRFTEAEQYYRMAKAIFEVVSPQSLQTGNTLYNMGNLYKDLKRFSEAEEYYGKARAVYEAVSPQSMQVTNALYNMGNLYRDLKRFSEAEEHYRKAKDIYEAVSPLSVQTAHTLYNMGGVYEAMEKTEDALSALRAALTLYTNLGYDANARDVENAISRLQLKK